MVRHWMLLRKYGFSHQTAFNTHHKVLLALQDLLENNPVLLSGVNEFDETFVLDCYKGGSVPPEAGRNARKHGARLRSVEFQMNISPSVLESSVMVMPLLQL